ncbi:unnamed protein product, partial [Sphacelaria rigidula]
SLKIFAAAKLIDFVYNKQHAGYPRDEVRQLVIFPFVTPEVMAGLSSEKDDFLVAASGAHSDYGLVSFWDDNKTRLASWYLVAIDITRIQPSSAFMERVFSIVTGCLDCRQEKALGDWIESTVMIKYNWSRKFDKI